MQKSFDMSVFFRRAISSVVLTTLFVSAVVMLPVWAFNAVIMIFLILGLGEFLKIYDKSISCFNMLNYLILGLGVILLHLCGLGFLGLTLAIIGAFVSVMLRKIQIEHATSHVALLILGFVCIPFFGSFMMDLRNQTHGILYVLFFIFVIKLSDIGAYIIGTRWGSIKIMPLISPKKSLQGCLGGLVFSLIAGIVLNNFFKIFSFGQVVGISIVMNVLGQFGDMCESLIKRSFGVKDSGGFIPGIGGIFDLLDSLLWAVPVMVWLTSVCK